MKESEQQNLLQVTPQKRTLQGANITLPERDTTTYSMFLSNRNVHNSNALRNRSNQYEYDAEILPYSRTRLTMRPLAFTLVVS